MQTSNQKLIQSWYQGLDQKPVDETDQQLLNIGYYMLQGKLICESRYDCLQRYMDLTLFPKLHQALLSVNNQYDLWIRFRYYKSEAQYLARLSRYFQSVEKLYTCEGQFDPGVLDYVDSWLDGFDSVKDWLLWLTHGFFKCRRDAGQRVQQLSQRLQLMFGDMYQYLKMIDTNDVHHDDLVKLPDIMLFPSKTYVDIGGGNYMVTTRDDVYADHSEMLWRTVLGKVRLAIENVIPNMTRLVRETYVDLQMCGGWDYNEDMLKIFRESVQ